MAFHTPGSTNTSGNADGSSAFGGWLGAFGLGVIGLNTEHNIETAESIERCDDVQLLLNGIAKDLNVIYVNPPPATTDIDTVEPSPSSSAQPAESPQMALLALRLTRTKLLLYDKSDTKYNDVPSQVLSILSSSSSQHHQNIIPLLLQHLNTLPFESRKDVSSIVCFLLCCNTTSSKNNMTISQEFALYVQSKYEDIMNPIVYGYRFGLISPLGPDSMVLPSPSTSSTSTESSQPQPPKPDVALHCGSMLRSTLRHPTLYQLFISPSYAPKYVYPFLDEYVHLPNFDVASDAIETLRVILTGCSSSSTPIAGGGDGGGTGTEVGGISEQDAELMTRMASEFLEREYESVLMERFNRKLLSKPKEKVIPVNNAAAAVSNDGNDVPPPSSTTTPPAPTVLTKSNYITRRMSIQLLTTILLTRINYNVMIKYISSRSNLVLIMLVLRDTSPHISLDAFHVFKIFVANPSKPPEVVKILVDNKVKLCKYLSGLHKEREASDEQFRDEKALVISTIEGLEMDA
mmetsp:Transcript_26073/g.38787  ORF Transcript_26073/g.38787 Transcript_26073/m.38787 type:complete len:518 (-) Transcript_26073:262-1815(-)